MNVLVLAPQPFYSERGTPIAIKLLLEEIHNNFPEYQLRLLVLPESQDVSLSQVLIKRVHIPRLFQNYLKAIPPGASLKKFVADVFFIFSAFKEVKQLKPDLIIGVEEGGFVAFLFKLFKKIPYFYDMDSLMSAQLIEKWSILKVFKPIFRSFEALMIKRASKVIAVCPALVEQAHGLGAKNVELLSDVALVDFDTDAFDYRKELSLSSESIISLYVGNLEHYQGVGLAIESFALVAKELPEAYFLIVGGNPQQIDEYSSRYNLVPEKTRVIFLGARPLSQLAGLLLGADILVSPRLKGINTPMKIYNYLASGKVVLATNLLTHSQVLNSELSVLAEPRPHEFADAWKQLILNSEGRENIGKKAKEFAKRHYSRKSFSIRVSEIFNKI